MNDSPNGMPRSFIQPRITSTPLLKQESIFATPPKPHILSPRRYSLSEVATPPRSHRRDHSRGNLYLNSTGPLLASTKYNVNVSTYEDTKSPGYASRIVQYNEEAERGREHRPSTHQSKYGSPGLFPVIHLFKKKLPLLEQKPRKVTVRIASPEYSRHHSQEYNRKLLEGIVKPTLQANSSRIFPHPGTETTSTRSVLDALKEISRKRIHASEEYELKESTGKRLRTEDLNGIDTNKRLRDDSSVLETSPNTCKPVSKRICVYDEYAASCSSMNFSFKPSNLPGSKRKSISISTFTENPKESKQVKLINVETQTSVDEKNEKTYESKEITSDDENQSISGTIDDKSVKEKDSPVKIFDDGPLERIRKNRLAALMGSLTGKDPVLAPKPNYETTLNSILGCSDKSKNSLIDIPKSAEKPLVSILSTPTKRASPNKSDKHVHFSIPESTSPTNLSSTSLTSLSVSKSSTTLDTPRDTGNTSVLVESKSQPNILVPPVTVNLKPSSSDTTTSVPVMTCKTDSNASSNTSMVSKDSSHLSMDTPSSNLSAPEFKLQVNNSNKNSSALEGTMFNTTSSAVPPTNQITFGISSIVSSPKIGGFKFDLTKPTDTTTSNTINSSVITTTTISSSPTMSFNNAAQKSNLNLNKPLFQNTNIAPVPVSAVVPSAGFSLISKSGDNSNADLSTSANLITSTSPFIVTPSANTSSSSFITFGANTSDNKTSALQFGLAPTKLITFGSPVITTVSTAFGTTATLTVPTKSDSGQLTTSTSIFGSQQNHTPISSAAAFGSGGLTTSTSATFSLGAPVTSTLNFGLGVSNTTTPAFSSSKATFGTSNATPSTGFGIPRGPSVATNFGTQSTTSAQNVFGSTSVPSSFATTLTTSALSGFSAPSIPVNSGFSTSSTGPIFGTNKITSPFGVTTTASSNFGVTSTVNATPFGKTVIPNTQSSFGTPTTTVSFGAVNAFGTTVTTTASSVFGGTNNTSSGFGTKTNNLSAPSSNTNIFGGTTSTLASGFGENNSKAVFGSLTAMPFGNVTGTTSVPTFGTSTTPSFTFGAKNVTSSSSFGGITTTNTGFGTSTTSAFGTSNSFGGTSSSFGSTNNVFGGATTTQPFGAVTTSTTVQSGGFGTTNSTSFGNNTGGFGTTSKTSLFGNTPTPAFGVSGTPAFGTSVCTAPGFVENSASTSAFAKPQVPQSNFGTASNAFGSSNSFGPVQSQVTSSFGTTNPPTTQAGIFSFGSGASVAKTTGVFSFGGASTEPPKPAFNFTGGNTTTPSFGSNSTPSFGSTGTPSFGAAGVPQFNAPQPAAAGMFSIGSGSTSTGRTRTQLKAKRRT